MTFCCKRCKHQWNPKTVNTIPIWCPNCHTTYWYNERTERRGRK